MPITSTTTQPTSQPAGSLPRWAWATGGALLLAVSGLASALVWKGQAAPAVPAETLVSSGASTATSSGSTHALPKAMPPATVAQRTAVPPCKDCGIVESVHTVQRKGAGTGLGAVAGGVLGGVVGHQMGGGSGKTAMTVLGAVGGGFAGNEVEKRARADSVDQVVVRMDDGTRRTLTLGHAPVARGDRVAVEGQNLRRLPADNGQNPA